MSENPQDRNVDQIRDILFGGQMRDYERRFQDLAERVLDHVLDHADDDEGADQRPEVSLTISHARPAASVPP